MVCRRICIGELVFRGSMTTWEKLRKSIATRNEWEKDRGLEVYP